MKELTRNNLKKMLLSASKELILHSDEITKIDALFEKRNYGLVTCKIGKILETKVENWEENISIKRFFTSLGEEVIACVYGTSGPLWGNLFIGLGTPLTNETTLTKENLKEMFSKSLSEVFELTPAGLGDKTFLDAYIPAVEYIKGYSGESITQMFLIAYKEAEKGAIKTKNYMAKFGTAKNYQEKTIGTIDIGAYSIAILFKGFSDSFSK
ncbi:dihydroxyacetone kinase subunit L [uncultured Cetobacterium sp.]|uniref:dihydroxyacetone kinase subunit L n=1 Tax=uncultured Cetobacterium sp. TaxID=527638 RepID=UPI00261594AE|nr:dihydroxyacetone kinase subunit L [uncultured Cetobacterium sp.]